MAGVAQSRLRRQYTDEAHSMDFINPPRTDGFPSWPILLTVKDPCLDFDLWWGCYSVSCVMLIFYANSLNTVLQLFICLSV